MCVCFSKMKREKMKKKRESRPKERRNVGEIEWMRIDG